MNEKSIKILSVVATITAVCMYVAYIPQIQANLAGAKGSPWQPLAASVNCTLWVAYGLFLKPRNWPSIVANVPGVVLGIVAFFTSL